jgi:hypothetical protein
MIIPSKLAQYVAALMKTAGTPDRSFLLGFIQSRLPSVTQTTDLYEAGGTDDGEATRIHRTFLNR